MKVAENLLLVYWRTEGLSEGGEVGGGRIGVPLFPTNFIPLFPYSLKYVFNFGVPCSLKYQKHTLFVPVFPVLFSSCSHVPSR